jgi:hypothetical protein
MLMASAAFAQTPEKSNPGGVSLFAQPPKESHPTVDEELQRNATYEFQNVDVFQGQAVTEFVHTLLGQSVWMDFNRAMKTTIIRAYNPGDAEKAVALLKKYDVPPPPKPEVEFTAYLVLASLPGQAPEAVFQSGPNTAKWTPPPIPAELQSALTQMKQTLADRTYWLRDTIVTKVIESTSIHGSLQGIGPLIYTLSYQNISVSRDGKSVQIKPFAIEVKPYSSQAFFADSSISTDTVIQEGQKLVIGKMATSFGDMYVVLTAKVQQRHE